LFQRNNKHDRHIQELSRKAVIAMKNTWSIGKRLFEGDYTARCKLFDTLVKGIMMYGAEVWGWQEHRTLETIQMKYLRWILGLDWATPNYIVQEETKRDLLRIETGKRATRYETKIRRQRTNKILTKILKDMDGGRTKTRWTEDRRKYFERCGWSEGEVRRRIEEGEEVGEELTERDRQVQQQGQRNKINTSKYNTNYKYFTISQQPPAYLTATKNFKSISQEAKMRCEGARYWEEQ
jgi:hypothetical protein